MIDLLSVELSLRLPHMQMAMHESFLSSQEDVAAMVKKAIAKECTPERVQELVDAKVRVALENLIDDATRTALYDAGEGLRKSMREKVKAEVAKRVTVKPRKQ